MPAINPRTNQPYFVTWVDNSNPNVGNGTYENPFSAMPGTAPHADLILVRTGNTTALGPLNRSIRLRITSGCWAKAESTSSTRTRNSEPTTYRCRHSICLDSPIPGNYPCLSGTPSTISLANNNEVSAFNILNSLGAGISNTLLGSHNFDLNYLNLISNTGGGISLSQATGVGMINNVNASRQLGGGIGIDSGSGPSI